MKQWQCPCGEWVPIGYSRHAHFAGAKQAVTLEQMRAVRAAEEAGLSHAVDVLAIDTTITYHWRTGKEPTREHPL